MVIEEKQGKKLKMKIKGKEEEKKSEKRPVYKKGEIWFYCFANGLG